MTNRSRPTPSGPKGFRAGAVAAQIRYRGRTDLAALVCERPAVTAAVTTRNLFCSAPVLLCRRRLHQTPYARGVIVNSGIANACTGDRGWRDAETMANDAERILGGTSGGTFLVASTGVIGEFLPTDRIHQAMPALAESLHPEGWQDFARAIMTTDTVPKISCRTVDLSGEAQATIIGVAKGSGMIHPNMATLLGFLATDYPLEPRQADALLRRVTERTLNCVTVDGDTSTSDTVLLMAGGAAATRDQVNTQDDAAFEAQLTRVAEDLARDIAADGEGATHLITVQVTGATDHTAAQRVAKTIAGSNLVKTAIFGRDPNWGRICCAAGYAGVPFDPGSFRLRLQNHLIMDNGLPTPFDREALNLALTEHDVAIHVDLGQGSGRAHAWTCDLTYEYVKINAEYTT